MSGATGLRFNFSSSSSRPSYYAHEDSTTPSSVVHAPFFERISTAEELQQCKWLIDTLQLRVRDLERINVDLEYRLEDQAKQCMSTEKECISLERKWRAKCDILEKDVETWKKESEAEKQRAAKLREHLSRTERELYSILQRKYEIMRAGPGGGGKGGKTGGSVSGGALADGKGGSTAALLRGRSNSGSGGGGTGGGGAGPGGGRGMQQHNWRDSFENESGGSGLRRSTHAAGDDVFIQQARAPKEIRQRLMVASLTDFLGL